jgi:hypothetical protein
LIIKECSGYELEKEKKNTSEDFFNRSSVTYIEDGEEKTFQLLYLRYFDELFSELTPYNQDPLFTAGGKSIHFKDVVALICLLNKPEYKKRKRTYINTQEELAACFEGFDFSKLPIIFNNLGAN